MFLEKELAERRLPELLRFTDGREVTADNWEERRLEILEVFKNEEYGFAPEGPFEVTAETVKVNDIDYAGKARSEILKIKVSGNGGYFEFPAVQYIPKNAAKSPAVLHITFRPDTPDRYSPIEEILDNGFAFFMFCYNDVTMDKDDGFSSGVASVYERKAYSWGKISMWAWAASRMMDYISTLPNIDHSNVAVAGHSRLGKTALWCAANDTRFKYALVNNSGCSGDAITRGKTGEHVARITTAFPHWFCENYKKYADNEDAMPFEQHWLVAAVAPRFMCSGTAVEDTWADPYSQFLSCYAASPAFRLFGLNGVLTGDRMPVPGDTFRDGNIGYHLRSGSHFFSRYDWNRYMEFMKIHR